MSDWDFRTIFEQSWLCLIWVVRDELLDGLIGTNVPFLVLLLTSNNMLICVNYFSICMLDILT